jgi:hypothetical protein
LTRHNSDGIVRACPVAAIKTGSVPAAIASVTPQTEKIV